MRIETLSGRDWPGENEMKIEIGNKVHVIGGFKPSGCSGSPATRGVVVGTHYGIEVYFSGWSTTAAIPCEDLMLAEDQRLSADEAQAVAECD